MTLRLAAWVLRITTVIFPDPPTQALADRAVGLVFRICRVRL